MARATYEGTKQLFDNKRPFVLTRAGFAGLQRYSAIWTGDNVAEENHMLLGVRLINSLGLSGVPFAGVDVGGFVGNGNARLMARWISIGAFSPFFRSHKEYNDDDSEPWAFGEETEKICRNYIQLHYNLLPYIYSSFYEATQTGIPVQRSLAINYTNDERIYQGNAVNEYLFGPSLLVVPYIPSQSTVPAYLPEGMWYDFYSDEKLEGNQSYYRDAPVEKLPVFVKAGSMIFMQSPIQYTAEKPSDTLMVHVYYGNEMNSQVYYEDGGDGFDYQNGAYFKRDVSYDPSSKKLIFENSEGNYASHFRYLKVFLHGFNFQNISVNGKSVSVATESFYFIKGITSIDALGNKSSQFSPSAMAIVLSNDKSRIEISW
jgi:alpha-glucosidase